MSQTISSQRVRTQSTSSPRRRQILAVILWVAQVVLALLFLFAGSIKLILPVAVMMAQMPLPLPLPNLSVHFIGIAEVAGALGLILPGLLRIRPGLTSLAAWGLVIDMVGATVYNLAAGEGATALVTVILGLVCVAVASGRREWGRA